MSLEFASNFHNENFNDDPLHDLLDMYDFYTYSEYMENANSIWEDYLLEGDISGLNELRTALLERLDSLIQQTRLTNSSFTKLQELDKGHPEVAPFKTESIKNLYSTFQEVHQGPLRSHIEAEFDIDLSEITFRSQLYFLQYLHWLNANFNR